MKSKYRYYLIPILSIFAIYVMIFIFGITAQRIINTNRDHYESSVTEEISADLGLRLDEYISKIESMEEFVDDKKVTGIVYDEFYLFASGLFQNDESIEDIAISPNGIHEFVYPVEYNEIIGHDLLNDEREHVVEAATRAIDNNEIVISGPYPNRTDPSVNIVVIRYPIYYDNGEFYALINVVVKTTVLFAPHESSQYDDIEFNVIDENNAILYGPVFENEIKNIDKNSLDYFGWGITFGRSEEYATSIKNDNRIADIVFFAISLGILIGGIIFVKSTVASKIERETRSIELDNSNKALTVQNLKTIKEKELAQSYLNIAGGIILIIDTNGNVSLMNKKGCSIIGLEENDIIGKNWFDNFVPEALREKTKKIFESIFTNDSIFKKKYENTILTSEGKTRLILWDNSILYDDNKNVIGVLGSGDDITELKQKEEELSNLSYRDQLTGLYNRRFFEEELNRLDNPRNLPLSVLIGDVNGLKLVNDAFGHKAGDELLKLIGSTISRSIRGNDIAARWGGDEFGVILPNSDSNAVEVLVKRIQKNIKESTFDYGSLSISFGMDTKKDKEDINDIFLSAEKLMYQNKLTEIDSVRGETINTIMTALFEKSAEVEEHSIRVSNLAVSIAKAMKMSKSKIADIKTIGMIHDIGKIVIDLQILDKPSKLSDEERELIQQHPFSGSRMLNSSHEYSRLSAGVLHHHERIDGTGYPNGIKGDQIPLESKIIAVADAYDAMTAKRPYRLKPLSKDEAMAELQKHSGTQFDKEVVDVFVSKVLLDSK